MTSFIKTAKAVYDVESELDFDGAVTVWFKRNFENVRVILKVLGHSHEIDVVVETEV